jgi:hypothetical protein
VTASAVEQKKMITADDFEPEALQASVWLRDQEIAPGRVLRWAMGQWAEFDGEPISIPSSEAIPPEAIVAQLSSRDGRHRLEIGRSRINIHRVRVDEPPLNLLEAAEALAGRLADLTESQETTVGRVAAVATNFEPSDDPAKVMARHFFRDRWLAAPLNRPEQLEIHAYKVFGLSDDLRVNSWVRVKSAKRETDLEPIVVVELDINSLEEERSAREFSRTDLAAFFRRATQEFATLLNLYFPGDAALEEA